MQSIALIMILHNFLMILHNFWPNRKFGKLELGPVNPFENGRKWPSPTGSSGTGASSTSA